MNTLQLQSPPTAIPDVVDSAPTRRLLVTARWPVGGIRTHLKYNAAALTRAGWRFTFVVPDDDGMPAFRDTFGGLPGVEIVGVPVRKKYCPLWRTTRELLRSGRFGLVHSHGLTAAVHTVGANLGVGVPHLTTVHDALRADQFPGVKGWLKRRAMGLILSRLDAAVCVTNDIRENVLEYMPGMRRERLTVVPNGIDAAGYCNPSQSADTFRRKLGIDDKAALLGFLGRFMEQKGFLPLLGALKRLLTEQPSRRWHLVAVGSGDRRREYLAHAGRLGLSRHVTVLDFVPDVRDTLAAFDLLVVPSLWEASSLVSMEAMALGVPVLGTDCIGLREVLRDTPSRVVRHNDEADLARGIAAWMDAPTTAAARAFAPVATDRFDNDRSAAKLLALYDALARVPARSRTR